MPLADEQVQRTERRRAEARIYIKLNVVQSQCEIALWWCDFHNLLLFDGFVAIPSLLEFGRRFPLSMECTSEFERQIRPKVRKLVGDSVWKRHNA